VLCKYKNSRGGRGGRGEEERRRDERTGGRAKEVALGLVVARQQELG
jgi:hypothetical protein